MTIKLADVLPGHWTTPDGHDMAQQFINMPRVCLYAQNMTDFELANAVFLHPNIVNLTCAKERIRWLSVQLAISNELLKQARSTLEMILETDSSDELLKRIDAQLTNHGISFTD